MPDYRRASVLITGGAGFVGAHLAARLITLGAEVTVLLRPSTKTWRFDALGIAPRQVRCDLDDMAGLMAQLPAMQPEYVFHLAAERGRDKLLLADKEGRSACAGVNVMRAARSDRLARFVSVGSSLEITESDAQMPNSLYGKAKLQELLALRALAAQTGTPFSATRTHYVYGPLQSPNKLIPVAIRAAEEAVCLPLTGPEIAKRYVFVLDLVEALLQVPDVPVVPDQVLLMTAAQQVSNRDVVMRISELMGKPIDVALDRFAPRDFDRPDWDLTRAGTPMPNWQAKTSFDEGLRACIAAQGVAHV